MNNIKYSPDVDARPLKISVACGVQRHRPIPFAEDEGNMILHYSSSGELVLIEILDIKQFISLESLSAEIPTR